ncbi:MAG: hypothetical protein ACKO1M_01910 [Planctomycetota bacterium]
MSPETITCVAALVAAAASADGGWLAQGTKAVPTAAWSVAASLALAADAAGRAAGWLTDPAAQAAARLGVAALAVCPAMSLLGAKRPQHGVWQLIVATLGFVLAMPALSATLVRPGSLPHIHMLERVFFLVLVGVGWMNFVATRRGLAASLVAAGQLGLIWQFLPGASPEHPPAAAVAALCSWSIAAGAVLAVVQSIRGPRGTRSGDLAGVIDPAYLALRETLGAAWALRICERFNSIAAARGWPCRLRFAGTEGDVTAGPWERDAIRCLRSILRRFVSPDWLARHGGLRAPGIG